MFKSGSRSGEYYFSTQAMCVGYHGKPLIKDISIGLSKGEILTLIGPNGAGKSTILKSIAGQIALIGGVVSLEGSKLLQMRREDLAKDLAVVFTDRLKSEMMTCEDVVATGRYPYTGKLGILTENDKKIVKETMDLVDITGIGNQDFTKISDGQRQRVMLARAICQEPKVLILDEPTSYLDVKYKLEFLSILMQLCKKKHLTVIMSLHELELAAKISDRILCVRGEYADRFGTPEEIFVPGYIKRLFGIFSGSFDEGNGSMELAAKKGEAKVFVIAGGGTGRWVYRRLQREERPFITGILFENDLDVPVARALASHAVITEAFEPIAEYTLAGAKKWLNTCETVICTRDGFGSMEEANKKLLQYAEEKGKKIELYGKSDYDTGYDV